MRHTPVMAATTMQNNDKNLKPEIKIFCPSVSLSFLNASCKPFSANGLMPSTIGFLSGKKY
ncbi:hypothetical protein I6938_02975 [Helicobacter pylori]|nr:hypothetical protein [Helicobacter pylori]MBH0290069.1 hypothetical protein [Helicobacter pylori]